MTPCPCPCPQVRRAIQQMLFQGKDFSWIRHVSIAVVLLTFINLLVIFAPSILGIFGMIGVWQRPAPVPPWALGVVGSTGCCGHPRVLWAPPTLPGTQLCLTPPCLSFPFSLCQDQVTHGASPSPIPVPAGWFLRCGAGCLLHCRTELALPLDISHPARCPAQCQGPGCRGGGMGTGPGHGVLGFLEGFVRAGGGGRGGWDRPWPSSGAGRAEPRGGGLCPLCPCLLQVPPLLPASSSSSLPSSTSASCPRTRSHCGPPPKSW